MNPSLASAPLVSDWLDFSKPGVVIARTGKSELGQGIDTALIQVIADTLSVSESRIILRKPDTTGPDEGFTAGSLSVQHSGGALLAAATHARQLFEDVARTRIGDDVILDDGTFASTSAAGSYWELLAHVDLDVPVDTAIRRPDPSGPIGRNAPRIDLSDKILGAPRYIQDLRPGGMLFGRIVRPPARGAHLLSSDLDSVRRRSGVTDVIVDGDLVAIVAETEIAAIEAATVAAGLVIWSGSTETIDDRHVTDFLTQVLSEDTDLAPESGTGPAPRETPGGATLSARYTRPFLAHASIAPSCAVAMDDGDFLQVWSHTQGVYPLRRDISRALGRDESSIRVTHVEGAGCYGHNAADDAAYDAALLATRLPGRPVQVTWSRKDELAWGPFGPAMVVDISATTDANGNVTSWSWDGYSNGHTSRPGTLASPALLSYSQQQDGAPIPASGDPPITAGGGTGRNAIPGYSVGTVRAVAHRALEMPIRASALRSLGAHMNVFAIEAHLDELARHHSIDPVEFRLRHLGDDRGRAVLESAAQMADWGNPVPEDHGRGIGYARYKGSGAWCAVVAEVKVVSDVRVTGLWIAADCGRVINPDGVVNQIEGGAVQSLSWTLKEQVRFAEGLVTSSTWQDYPIMTFSEVPPIAVTILDRPSEPWVGAGEASMGPTAAAVGNAVASALGVRVCDLPLTNEAILAALG